MVELGRGILTAVATTAIAVGIGVLYGWPYALITAGALVWIDQALEEIAECLGAYSRQSNPVGGPKPRS